jgi:hypothetical protein
MYTWTYYVRIEKIVGKIFFLGCVKMTNNCVMRIHFGVPKIVQVIENVNLS